MKKTKLLLLALVVAQMLSASYALPSLNAAHDKRDHGGGTKSSHIKAFGAAAYFAHRRNNNNNNGSADDSGAAPSNNTSGTSGGTVSLGGDDFLENDHNARSVAADARVAEVSYVPNPNVIPNQPPYQ